MALPSTLHTCITIISKSQEWMLKIINLGKKKVLGLPSNLQIQPIKIKKRLELRSIPFSFSSISKKNPAKNDFKLSVFDE